MAVDITLNLDDAQEAAAVWKTAQFNAVKTRDNPLWQAVSVNDFVRMHAAEKARAWRIEQIEEQKQLEAEAIKVAEGLV